jgi:hypothetical protein
MAGPPAAKAMAIGTAIAATTKGNFQAVTSSASQLATAVPITVQEPLTSAIEVTRSCAFPIRMITPPLSPLIAVPPMSRPSL